MRVDTGAFIGDFLGPITLLKMGVGCPCLAGNRIMEGSSGSAFLASCVMMDRLGLTISCVPVCVGDSEVLLKVGLLIVNLAVDTAVLTSCGVELSLPIQIISLGVRKMHAPLRAVSVTISFRSTVLHTPKVSRIYGTYSVTSWSIGQIAPWMIFGTNQFFNNFCEIFLLVV